MSENSDAYVIVVSEETGTVSSRTTASFTEAMTTTGSSRSLRASSINTYTVADNEIRTFIERQAKVAKRAVAGHRPAGGRTGGAAYPQGGGKNGRQFAERVRDAFRARGKKQGVSGQPEGTADDSRASDGGPPDGSLTIKRNKKLDIAARIGCVLVALVIWVYVMANDSPAAERTFGVDFRPAYRPKRVFR